MPITLHLPPALTRESGITHTDVAPGTVDTALDALDRKCPGLADRIRTETHDVRRHILIYINDTEVRELDGLRSALKDGDRVFIVQAVSGG